MTNNALTTQTNPVEAALMQGDVSKLSVDQRLRYYKELCESLGLNPLTSPFQYLTLNGKMVLYATKAAAEQLRSVKGISITKVEKELLDGMLVVTAYGEDKSGRRDTSTAALDVSSLKGEAKANAFMKCETKAKRRLTLSLAGLGMMDETEVETVPGAVRVQTPLPTLPEAPKLVTIEQFPVAPTPAPETPEKAPSRPVEPSEAPAPVQTPEAPKNPVSQAPATEEAEKPASVPLDALETMLSGCTTVPQLQAKFRQWRSLKQTAQDIANAVGVYETHKRRVA
jgi:hypothetical protein